jgi:uncharacterized protein
MRDAGNFGPKYDIDKMLAKVNGQFILFGGEPLLLSIPELERIWKFGFEKYGANGLQSNGELVREEHIRLFKDYNVHVGISFDGPGRLNSARSDKTGTELTEAGLDLLLKNKVKVSIIVTLHALNASRDRIDELIAWIKKRHDEGVSSFRLHFLENDGADHLILPEDEHIESLKKLYSLDKERNEIFDIFKDIRKGFNDDPNRTCVWTGCDPYTTRAVHGIDGQGNSTNCGRINKEGIEWQKASTFGSERQLALFYTPQEYGGCKGCEFFSLCTGECPGTGINGDWRNKTAHCKILMELFNFMKNEEGLEVKNRVQRESNIIIGVRSNERSHSDSPHQDETVYTEHGDSTFFGIAQIGRPASL